MNASLLIVEDSIIDRQFYQASLAKQFDLTFASNGNEALKLLRRFNPDLILTDLVMPQCDGWSFIDSVRNKLNRLDIPIIAVTGSIDISKDDRLLEMGVLGIIAKPFQPSKLAQQVKNLIALHQQIRSKAKHLPEYIPEKKNMEEDGFRAAFDKVVQSCVQQPEVNLEQVARGLNMSVPTLMRKVKQHYGCSPMKLIGDAKLDLADRLLQEGVYTVKEAAFEAGFESPSYFIKAYKKKFGKTPGAVVTKN